MMPTPEDLIREIRKKYSTKNYSYRTLAEEYDWCAQYIGKIVRREVWNHI